MTYTDFLFSTPFVLLVFFTFWSEEALKACFSLTVKIWACDNKINTVHWEEPSSFFSGNAPSVTRPAVMRLISPWRRYLTALRGPGGRSRGLSNSSHRRCRQSPKNIKWEARCVSTHWKCTMWSVEIYFILTTKTQLKKLSSTLTDDECNWCQCWLIDWSVLITNN